MKITKSAALKASLLLVLAANISWEHFESKSTELALSGPASGAESVGGSGTASSSSTTTTGPISKAPNSITVKANGDAPAPVTVSKPETKVESKPEVKAETTVAAKPSQPTFESELKICGEDYKVHYAQLEEEGITKTRITSVRASTGKRETSIVVATNLINTIGKQDAPNRQLMATVRAFRLENKESCGDEKVSVESDEKEVAISKEEEKKRLAKDVDSCKVDSDGTKLERSEKIDCLIEAIRDADERVERRMAAKNAAKAKEKKTKKSKYSRDRDDRDDDVSPAAVLAEVQGLYSQLKGLLRDELLPQRKSRRGDTDDNSEQRENAEEMARDAIDAISDIAKAYNLGKTRNGRSSNTISKMIGEISALRNGSQMYAESESYVERAQNIRDDLRASTREAMANPTDPMAIQNYRQSTGEYWDLKNQMTDNNFELNRDYRQLKAFQSASLLSAQDFTKFSDPYKQIQELLDEAIGRNSTGPRGAFTGPITSSALGTDLAIPTNLAAMRGVTPVVGRPAFPLTAPTLHLPSVPNMAPVQAPYVPPQRSF
jgi:hypothetical protein